MLSFLWSIIHCHLLLACLFAWGQNGAICLCPKISGGGILALLLSCANTPICSLLKWLPLLLELCVLVSWPDLVTMPSAPLQAVFISLCIPTVSALFLYPTCCVRTLSCISAQHSWRDSASVATNDCCTAVLCNSKYFCLGREYGECHEIVASCIICSVALALKKQTVQFIRQMLLIMWA